MQNSSEDLCIAGAFFYSPCYFYQMTLTRGCHGEEGKKRKYSLQLRLFGLTSHHDRHITKEIKIRDSQSFAEIVLFLLDLFICFSNWIQCHSKFQWLSPDVTGQTVSIPLRRSEAFFLERSSLKTEKVVFSALHDSKPDHYCVYEACKGKFMVQRREYWTDLKIKDIYFDIKFSTFTNSVKKTPLDAIRNFTVSSCNLWRLDVTQLSRVAWHHSSYPPWKKVHKRQAGGGLKTFDSLKTNKVKLNRQPHVKNEKVYCKTRNATKISCGYGYRSYVFWGWKNNIGNGPIYGICSTNTFILHRYQ